MLSQVLLLPLGLLGDTAAATGAKSGVRGLDISPIGDQAGTCQGSSPDGSLPG